MTGGIKCLQINLNTAKGASSVFGRRFVKEKFNIGFVQEPHTIDDRIVGLPSKYYKCKLVYNESGGRPRAALLFNERIPFFPLTEFMTNDLACAIVNLSTGNCMQKVVVASSYFPGDINGVPPPEVIKLVEHCKASNLHLITGCDSNSWHESWGSSETRTRGELLQQFFEWHALEVLNVGSIPTWRHEGLGRESFIDLTFCTSFIKNKIKRWHVSSEPSLSDHRHICFTIESKVVVESTRIPKLTDWGKFETLVKEGIGGVDVPIYNTEELNQRAEEVNKLLLSAYESSCPLKTRRTNRDVPWWSKRLGSIKKHVRKLANLVKSIDPSVDPDLREAVRAQHKKALTAYSTEIRRSKRRSWRKFCGEIEDLPTASRIHKILSKDHSVELGSLRKPDGTSTRDGKESANLLLATHFPGCNVVDANQASDEEIRQIDFDNRLWADSALIFSHRRVKKAIKAFKPYKTAGPDGIFPALIQNTECLIPVLRRIFRCSYVLGHIPLAWRGVRIAFVPKAGRRDRINPKSHRPISLMSFMLKSMEKVLGLYIRLNCLAARPLNPRQFAYQPGKSTETALHHLVKKIEKSIEKGETAMSIFIDIEGAFDNTAFDSIRHAAERKGLGDNMIQWIRAMLESRIISTKVSCDEITVKATRGCPQGGVLSPLLWSLVVDELLNRLENLGFEVTGYADDLVITIRSFDTSTISDRVQEALNIVWSWCQEEGLKVNPEKTVLIPFNGDPNSLTPPTLNGVVIEYSNETKYLGVVLDRELNWNAHLKYVTDRAINRTAICKRLVGQKWGLKPVMLLWLYRTIIRPMITYASLVWWPKVEKAYVRDKLAKVQRLITVMITGAVKSAPSVALDVMLDLNPLQDMIKKEAALSALRLLDQFNYIPGNFTGHLSILSEFHQLVQIKRSSDQIPKRHCEISFEIRYPCRLDWINDAVVEHQSEVYYTDGSKTDEGVGIGVTGPEINYSESLGQSTTIFHAEVYAIMVCARYCLDCVDLSSRSIAICSDSQAALKALDASDCKSRLVLQCLETLEELSTRCALTLFWVPGHEGIKGNETADYLARVGAKGPFTGPEPTFGFGAKDVRDFLDRWADGMKLKHFRRLPIRSMSRKFMKYDRKWTRLLLSLPKFQFRALTGYLTGHGRLNSYFARIGVLQARDAACRKCGAEQETVEHLLCICPAIATTRLKQSNFGLGFPTPEKLIGIAPRKILNFFKEIGIVDT